MDNSRINTLHDVLEDFVRFQKTTIPLCAAENIMSDFCKIPLDADLQERYIMGNVYSFNAEDNFVGSEYLLPIYSLIHESCKTLFGAAYTDARTLTGMNCLTTLLMALTDTGDKIAILSSDWGGHPSVQSVCERLGLIVYNLPYNDVVLDIDYTQANKLIKEENIRYILLAPSDILRPISIEQLDLKGRELYYDVSQIMGLIAGGVISCPLQRSDEIVIFGGTHKTLPGPASGLIMTNSEQIHNRLEYSINPQYLRNTQMHQVASLLFALLEMEHYGSIYAHEIVKVSNQLGKVLRKNGFNVGRVSDAYSETHQVFIYCDKDEMEIINKNAIRFGITLNKKTKKLFAPTGIRLGTQEIARYGWDIDAIETIGIILSELRVSTPNSNLITRLKEQLPSKSIKYTFPKDVYESFYKVLHQK